MTTIIYSSSPPLATSIEHVTLEASVVQACAAMENGDEACALYAQQKFLVQNPDEPVALAFVESMDDQIRQTKSLIGSIETARAHTSVNRQTIVAETDHKTAWFLRGQAAMMLVMSCLAFWMMNKVGTLYLVASGNDLFAIDPDAARLFMGITLLAGAALKAFDKVLTADRARQLYTVTLFAIGITAFIAWIGASALSFAPQVGGNTNWLVTGQGGETRLYGIVLFASHVISDCACGYIVLAAAESLLLAGHRRVVIANPAWEDLTQRLEVANEQHAALSHARAHAQGYLDAFGAGLQSAAERARFLVRAEVEQLKLEQQVAVNTARAKLFS